MDRALAVRIADAVEEAFGASKKFNFKGIYEKVKTLDKLLKAMKRARNKYLWDNPQKASEEVLKRTVTMRAGIQELYDYMLGFQKVAQPNEGYESQKQYLGKRLEKVKYYLDKLAELLKDPVKFAKKSNVSYSVDPKEKGSPSDVTIQTLTVCDEAFYAVRGAHSVAVDLSYKSK